jgi:hypothetical protein
MILTSALAEFYLRAFYWFSLCKIHNFFAVRAENNPVLFNTKQG